MKRPDKIGIATHIKATKNPLQQILYLYCLLKGNHILINSFFPCRLMKCGIHILDTAPNRKLFSFASPVLIIYCIVQIINEKTIFYYSVCITKISHHISTMANNTTILLLRQIYNLLSCIQQR